MRRGSEPAETEAGTRGELETNVALDARQGWIEGAIPCYPTFGACGTKYSTDVGFFHQFLDLVPRQLAFVLTGLTFRFACPVCGPECLGRTDVNTNVLDLSPEMERVSDLVNVTLRRTYQRQGRDKVLHTATTSQETQGQGLFLFPSYEVVCSQVGCSNVPSPKVHFATRLAPSSL